MKKLLKLLGIFCLIISTFSFSSKESDWKVYFENKEIKIESKLLSCDKPAIDIHNSYVVLKITNKTNQALDVTFQKELWYNEVCSSCTNSKEFKTQVSLNPMEVIEGFCDSKTKELKFFQSSPDSKTKLTKFELKMIEVTPKK